MSKYLDQVLDNLTSMGIQAKPNIHNTSVHIKSCVFCGNDRWNLDIELTDRFVFSCWACSTSGSAKALLAQLKSTVIVPTPSGRLQVPTPKTMIYHNYWSNAKLSWTSQRISGIKEITPDKPIKYGDLQINRGNMLLGLLSMGVMLADNATKRSRKTASDLFLYEPVKRAKTLAIVENFYDIFPFFENTTTLVLGGTFLKRDIISKLNDFISPTRIFLALDQNAESVASRQLRNVFPEAEIIVLFPDQHSPSSSSSMVGKSRFFNC